MENTTIHEHPHPRTPHHPHMIKVNVMAKLNTVPDTALNDIEKFLETFEVEKCRNMKIDSRRNFDIKSERSDF